MSQSPAIAATTDGELVSPEGTQEDNNSCHIAAIRQFSSVQLLSSVRLFDAMQEIWVRSLGWEDPLE